MEEFSRILPILGKDALNKLKDSHVAVFRYWRSRFICCRSSCSFTEYGTLTIIDNDKVDITNINRQLIALHSTIGSSKVEVAKKRLLDINPSLNVYTYNVFVDKNTIEDINFNSFDFIVDAIDTVASKILIIKKAKEYEIPVISSMGTGNKKDPLKFRIVDISKTNTCPLARVMRKELSKLNIKDVKVLFSTEEPILKSSDTISSLSYVPGVAGLLIAGEVIFDLIK